MSPTALVRKKPRTTTATDGYFQPTEPLHITPPGHFGSYKEKSFSIPVQHRFPRLRVLKPTPTPTPTPTSNPQIPYPAKSGNHQANPNGAGRPSTSTADAPSHPSPPSRAHSDMLSDTNISDTGLGLGLRYLDLKEIDDHDDVPLGVHVVDDENVEETTLGKPPRRKDASTPPPHISSPSIPSPMSLGHLGIVPLTPLGKQLAASLGRTPETPLRGSHRDASSDHGSGPRGLADEELTQGSKVQLIQRLTALTQKLVQGSDVPDQITLDLLLRRVDEIDRVVDGHPPSAPFRPHLTCRPAGSIDERGSFFGSPSSSWMHSRYSSLSLSVRAERPKTPEPVVKKPDVDSFKIASEAEKLTAELDTLVTNLKARQEESEHIHDLLVTRAEQAEKLTAELDTLVTNLKARQEESEHIHDLLVTRAERAAQRIIFLQSRVQDLEAELHDSDTDLSHLRLGLKAIEVQCPRDFLATHAAVELAQSIANWKADYAALKQRRAARRIAATPGASSTLGTPARDYNSHHAATPSYQSSIAPSYQTSIAPSYESPIAPSPYQSTAGPSPLSHTSASLVTPTRDTFSRSSSGGGGGFPFGTAFTPPHPAAAEARRRGATPPRSVRVRKLARLNGTPRRKLEYGGHGGGYRERSGGGGGFPFGTAFTPPHPAAAEAPPETPRSDASSTATPESYTPSVAASSSRTSARSVRVRKLARLNGTPRRKLEYGGHGGGYRERY
ncbi:hypothetical protein BN1723_012770 [Verticillium longisporum]|uniref:Uncharacterized protein n=1 Tax=Verticillium longisporum TaxID=100787 RepID=A0A0G4LM94_VERLO|nr:hypothetical protein BN1723_012770 [Verticillium longisporum]